jgi:signal transduction histidine kinase
VRTKQAYVVIAAVVAGGAAAWLAAHRTFEPYQTARAPLALLVGWSFIGSGLAACRVHADSPLGKVMMLTGFAWFASFLTDAHQSLLFSVGTAVQSVYLVGFVYLVLTFPSGRLRTGFERFLIWSGVAVVTVVAMASLLFSDSNAVLCKGCPGNALEIARDDVLANGLLQFQRIGGVAVVVLALALIVVRWSRASALRRRTVAPVVLGGGVTLAVLIVSVVNDALSHPLGQVPKDALFVALATLPVGMVLVLLQRRLARAAVAGLVVELGEPDVAKDLRGALARALGDPSLEVAYWYPQAARYVGSDGRPVELPAADSGRACDLGRACTTVVERDGQPVAALIHDSGLRENAGLIESVCAAAAMTLENERLQAELRARLAELQASRARLVDATEAERRRIERDLHDGTQQRLVSLAMSLGLLETKLPADPEAAKPIAHEARAALAVALEELRELSQGIHPAVLTERGLAAALEELADRAALPAYLEVSIDERPCEAVEAAAYFVVSEALTNAAKHSHGSEVRITASRTGGLVTVEVEDNGIGGAVPAGGSGLRGLTDRVEALGGRLTVSSPPGRGTSLRADIPCE